MGRMRATLTGLVALGAIVVFAVPAGAAVDREKVRRAGPLRVLLVGDSITASYQDEAALALRAKGYEVLAFSKGSTGLLDATWCKGQYALMLESFDADVVVYENVGNYAGPHCSPTTERESGGFYRQWRRSALRSERVLSRNGARFLWMLNPACAHDGYTEVVPRLNQIYGSLGTETVDAWDAFGSWTYNPRLHDDQGLHLNQAGQQLMAATVVTAVG